MYEKNYLCHFGTAYHHLWVLSIIFDIAPRHRRTTGRRHPFSRQCPPGVPVSVEPSAIPAVAIQHLRVRHWQRELFNTVQLQRVHNHPAVELQRLIQAAASVFNRSSTRAMSSGRSTPIPSYSTVTHANGSFHRNCSSPSLTSAVDGSRAAYSRKRLTAYP